MNFGFTEEQDFLRDAVRKFVDDRCPLPEVRTLMETEDAMSPALWDEIASLGWLGLLVGEEHGAADWAEEASGEEMVKGGPPGRPHTGSLLFRGTPRGSHRGAFRAREAS